LQATAAARGWERAARAALRAWMAAVLWARARGGGGGALRARAAAALRARGFRRGGFGRFRASAVRAEAGGEDGGVDGEGGGGLSPGRFPSRD
jgi:hypothetical protein